MCLPENGFAKPRIILTVGAFLLLIVSFFVISSCTNIEQTTSDKREAMDSLSEGTTSKVLLGAYTEALQELIHTAERWDDESSAAMIQITKETLLSLRVPAPLRAAHLQTVLQVQALSESDSVQDVATKLLQVVQALIKQAEQISTTSE